MPACNPISPAAGSAETMVATVDCYVQSGVQAGYASLLGPGSTFGTALTIALTLYVAFVGYRLIFGRAGLSIGDLAPRMLLIGAVLALTSNWATYQTLVYDVLTDGPEEIASAINPGAGKASLNERVDMLSGRMVDLADAWTEFDAQVRADTPAAPAALPAAAPETLPASASGAIGLVAPRDSLGPNMLLVSALLLVLASAGVLVIAKIILGLLLLLGPIFALLALFTSTRGLALGWARAAVMMALVPVMATMTTAGAVTLLEPMVIDMYVAAGEGVFSLRAALTIMVVLLVMVAVSVQLFRIGRTIVGGWTLGFGQNAPANASRASVSGAVAADAAPLVHNERMQSLVGSIERAAIAASTTSAAAPQRQILLPQRSEGAYAPPAANVTQSDRRVPRGRASAVRAPIKPVRSAA